MYTALEDRRGDDRRATPRGDRPYGRRIDCEEDDTRTFAATPARGGGRPAPDAWSGRGHESRS